MKDYRIFLGSRNETWHGAIERFQQFREAEMTDYFTNKDYSYRFAENHAYNYHHQAKVSSPCIAEFESKGISVPNELVELLCKHGTFKIGNTLLEIYDEKEGAIMTLSEVLAKYGHGSFVDQISSGMLKSLSGFYFFFGVSFPESDEMSFLYFSKAGNFGKMLFSPNNPALVLQKVLPSMFNGSIDKYTLDSLISNQIDRVVVNALTVKGYID